MASSTSTATPNSIRQRAIFFMVLLTIQFGCQPLLTIKYTSSKICRSSVLFVQEALKLCLATFMLYSTGDFHNATQGWTVRSWIQVAFVPAALYTLQNSLALLAYQNLDGVTFNVLNQTKTLSAALCCYWLMEKRQSRIQILSLLLLLLSALVLERIVSIDFLLFLKNGSMREGDTFVSLGKSDESQIGSGGSGSGSGGGTIMGDSISTMNTKHFTHGVAPVLGASFLSGLAGAISQKNLQSSTCSSGSSSSSSSGGGRNPYLFSAELCVASLIVLSISLFWSNDGKQMTSQGFFYEWTPYTMIPIFTNAMGGIVVGLVTKYAGSVRKGFALIFGMLFTGIIQSILVVESSNHSISKEQLVGGMLAALSLWLHATHPYKESITFDDDHDSIGTRRRRKDSREKQSQVQDKETKKDK